MRYLAIDVGAKRTGLAVGDDVTGIATPHGTIETASESQRLTEIKRAVDDLGPDALVVGLPVNMDGTEGEPAKRMRAFANTLADQLHLPVHLTDERLTSAAADDQMAQTGLTHKQKKARRDALAAANILRGFLNSKTSFMKNTEAVDEDRKNRN